MSIDPKELHDRLAAIVERERDAIVADTQRILRFRTVSGGNAQEEELYQREIPACFAWLAERAQAMGFDFRVIEGIVGEITWRHPKADAPIVAIAGHIDVVTPGAGAWTHPPFGGDLADGSVWGRGAQDDKGPMVQALHAMHIVKGAGIKLPCTVKLVIGTQEETGNWSDMDLYRRVAPAPDCAFTPDADFPIINGEKGMLNVVATASWDRTGRDAETGMEFVSLVGGERENVIPGACELTIRFPKSDRNAVLKELVRATTEFVVEHSDANVTMVPGRERAVGDDRFEAVVSFVGKAGHASTPDKGHNAILDALDFLKDIETMPMAVRKFAALAFLMGSRTDGATLGIAAEHPFIGRTTACLTLLDVRQEGAKALINVRPTMGSTGRGDLSRIAATFGEFDETLGLNLSVESRGEPLDPIYMNPDEPATKPFVDALRGAYTAATGRDARLHAIGGTTYAKAVSNCLAFGPIDMEEEESLIHQPDERVSVAAILRNVRVYATALALLENAPLRRR